MGLLRVFPIRLDRRPQIQVGPDGCHVIFEVLVAQHGKPQDAVSERGGEPFERPPERSIRAALTGWAAQGRSQPEQFSGQLLARARAQYEGDVFVVDASSDLLATLGDGLPDVQGEQILLRAFLHGRQIQLVHQGAGDIECDAAGSGRKLCQQ